METLSILSYFPILLLYLIACFFCGYIICHWLRINPFQQFKNIVYLVTGLIFIVSTYAIYTCSGITIMIGIMALSLLTVPFFRNKETIQKLKFEFNHLRYLFGLASFWFLIYLSLYLTYFGTHDVVSSLNGDLIFYQKIGYLISQTGNENTIGTLNLYDPNLKGAIQYHYFDIYIPEIIFKIFGGYPVKVHVLVACPFIMTIGSLLIVSYAKFKSINFLPALLVFSGMLVFSGIDFDFSIKNKSVYIFPYLAGVELKIILPLIFILGSMIMFNIGMGIKSILPLIVIPLITFTYLPSVIAGTMLFLLIYLIAGKIQLRSFLIYFLLTFFVLIFFISFYQLYTIPNELSRINSISITEAIKHTIQTPGQAIRIFAGSLFKFWLDYLPNLILIVIILIFSRSGMAQLKERKYEIFLFVMIFLFGLAGWSLFASITVEAPQLFLLVQSNIIIAATIIVVVGNYNNISNPAPKYTILVLCISYFCYEYTDKLIRNPFLFASKSSRAFSIDALSHIHNDSSIQKNHPVKIAFFCELLRPEAYLPGEGLLNFDQSIILTSISPSIISGEFKNKINRNFYVLEQDSMLTKDFITSPFYVYSKQFKTNSGKLDMLELQRGFIRDNNIKFIISKKESCDDYTGILNDFRFISIDSISGTILYKIKS